MTLGPKARGHIGPCARLTSAASRAESSALLLRAHELVRDLLEAVRELHAHVGGERLRGRACCRGDEQQGAREQPAEPGDDGALRVKGTGRRRRRVHTTLRRRLAQTALGRAARDVGRGYAVGMTIHPCARKQRDHRAFGPGFRGAASISRRAPCYASTVRSLSGRAGRAGRAVSPREHAGNTRCTGSGRAARAPIRGSAAPARLPAVRPR